MGDVQYTTGLERSYEKFWWAKGVQRYIWDNRSRIGRSNRAYDTSEAIAGKNSIP